MNMADKKRIVESIVMEDEEEEKVTETNTLKDAVNEIGNQLFDTHIEQTGNYNNTNKVGIVKAMALNEYMERIYGRRYAVLDVLCLEVSKRSLSVKGFGIEKFIESIKNIQATYEQVDASNKLTGLLRR